MKNIVNINGFDIKRNMNILDRDHFKMATETGKTYILDLIVRKERGLPVISRFNLRERS